MCLHYTHYTQRDNFISHKHSFVPSDQHLSTSLSPPSSQNRHFSGSIFSPRHVCNCLACFICGNAMLFQRRDFSSFPPFSVVYVYCVAPVIHACLHVQVWPCKGYMHMGARSHGNMKLTSEIILNHSSPLVTEAGSHNYLQIAYTSLVKASLLCGS